MKKQKEKISPERKRYDRQKDRETEMKTERINCKADKKVNGYYAN
jgi:hypothetical protein